MVLKDGRVIEQLRSIANAKKELAAGAKIVAGYLVDNRLYKASDIKSIEDLVSHKEGTPKQISNLYSKPKAAFYKVVG